MTERCALTELPVDGCAHCRGHNTRVSAERLFQVVDTGELLDPEEFGPEFTAHYDGRCAVCGYRTHEGDILVKLEDGSGYACSRHLP